MVISPPKIAVPIDSPPMLAAPPLYPYGYISPGGCSVQAGGFEPAFESAFESALGLDRDIVDQPRGSDFGGDQHPHRSLLERGDRRQRLGMADLEIIQR